MRNVEPSWQAILALACCIAAIALGALSTLELDAIANPTASINYPFLGSGAAIRNLLIVAAVVSMIRMPARTKAILLLVFGRMVLLFGRPLKVLPPKSR